MPFHSFLTLKSLRRIQFHRIQKRKPEICRNLHSKMMSAPMEISISKAEAPEIDAEAPKVQNGVALESNAFSPMIPEQAIPVIDTEQSDIADDNFLVSVEVCLKPSSTARFEDVRLSVERMLEKRCLSYTNGPVPFPDDDQFLLENVHSICVCDTELLRTGILKNLQETAHDIMTFHSLKEKMQSCETQETQASLTLCMLLLQVAEACENLSGRSLRKLPFLTHTAVGHTSKCDPAKFLSTMINTAKRERSELPD